MIYLSGKATKEDRIGTILTFNGYNTKRSDYIDKPWAIDNGCFAQPSKYSDEKYLEFLNKFDQRNCLFAVAPDVVADAVATKERSLPMLRQIRSLGFKCAYVGQDGEVPRTVYWDEFDCLFIGGSTEWKLSQYAGDLIKAAKEKNKWVHMGRVNTWQRIRAASVLGCDSADGTCIAFGPDKNTPIVLGWMTKLQQQPFLQL